MKTNFITQSLFDSKYRIFLLFVLSFLAFNSFADEEENKLLPPPVPTITAVSSSSCYTSLAATGCVAPYTRVEWYKDGYYYAFGASVFTIDRLPQPAFLKARCHDGAGTYGAFSSEIKYIYSSFAEVITPSPTVCIGGTVTLNASSASSTLTYQWYRNNVLIPSATSLSYTTGTTGDYKVFTASLSCGIFSKVLTITNGVPPAPVLSWNSAPSGYCQSQLTVTGCPPPATNARLYRNDGVAGWTNLGASLPYFIPSSFTPLDYRATCVLGGCESLPSNVVRGTPNNFTRIIPINPAVCTSGSVTLTALTTFTGLNYQWKLAGVNVGTNSPTYITSALGSYTIVVTTPSSGCSFTSKPAVFTAVSPPMPTITSTVSSPATITHGESLILTANGCSGLGNTITWSTGANTPTITVSPASITNFTFICTRLPCTGVVSPAFVINVIPLSSPMLLSTSVSTCTGTSVTLTGSCTLGTFYWTDTPITPSLSIIVSPSITTTYNAACYSGVVSSTSTITITVFDGAIISLSSGDWTNPSTWSCSCIPAPCNDVTVATGNIVNIPISLTGRLKNLTVKGTITMKNSSMMKLK